MAKDGCLLAAEKRIISKLLDIRKSTEKMHKIDDHVMCAVAGITADANILINYARLEAQRYLYQYQEPIPIEQLMHRICDLKQSYTQFGGLRPFGVSFLMIGWDKHFGFQLFQSDPSGNFGGWKAQAIGANNEAGRVILKADYKKTADASADASDEKKSDESDDDNNEALVNLKDAETLAVKVLSKTLDTTAPTPDKLEFAKLSFNDDGELEYHVYTKPEIKAVLKTAAATLKKAAESSGDI